MSKILIIDDEENFRSSLSERLKMRGYDNVTLPDGHDAVKIVRGDPDIDVVILDLKMPGPSGEEVLKEMKYYRPALQVIVLTGHGSTESAVATGKLDAYSYLLKPIELDKLIEVIDSAREEKIKVMEKYEIPHVEKGSFKSWLSGTHNSRPGIIMVGGLIFMAMLLLPAPQKLKDIIGFKKTDQSERADIGEADLNAGYSDYRTMEVGESINEYYSHKYKLGKKVENEQGKEVRIPLTVDETAFRAKIMLAVLIVAALFWASGAIPIGITALMIGVVMYFFGVLKPDDIASAFAKDAVVFIFGVLAFAAAITKTGLDRRIGLLLMGSSKSMGLYMFLFVPLFGVTSAFLSQHALIAFVMPVLLIVYLTSVKAAGLKDDRPLAITLLLSVTYASNCGGPGSPAAGGRNAIMIGILKDYGVQVSFMDWVMYGLPYVPVMAIVISLYFYFFVFRKSKVRKINVSTIVKQAADKIGPMNKNEVLTAIVLVGLVFLWIGFSDKLGLGGPVLLAILVLNILRILTWRDVSKVHWEVVFLYAAAAAMGKGLAVSGGALFLAQSFVDVLPEFFTKGQGLGIAASLFTGIATNFMSDGATVAALGPITVPMATIQGTSEVMVGLTTAFASSFAHMLIIGTPANAIVFTMAKNPITGKQLVGLGDFMKHGSVIVVLSFLVMWFGLIYGYWSLFPNMR